MISISQFLKVPLEIWQMASLISSVKPFSSESLKTSSSIPRSAVFPAKLPVFSRFSSGKSVRLERSFTVSAVSGYEGPSSTVAVLEKEISEIDVLKRQLLDSFYGTNRGLSASSETRAEIVELITQLEAKNPTPAPTEALSLLNGKWILAYTTFAGLFPLLSRAASLPLVKLEEISQTIDSENFTVQNSFLFSGPLATTSISTNSTFEVRSPKRVQIKFVGGVIGTPQVSDSIEIPENVEFLGQKIDLTPFKGLLSSVQDTASSVAKTFSSQPPFKFSIPDNSNVESWILTTYLDNELRISRGDGGAIFVLIKEGYPLLNP